MPFVIFEKNDDVGGTWLENTYPGCRVDNPNHNYSYSFAQRHDWPFHFSHAGRAARLLPPLRRRVRAARAHPVRDRGAVARRGPKRIGAGRSRSRDARRPRRTVDAERGHQRGRSAQPPAVPRHQRPRLVRGPDLPLRTLGPRRRSPRQARRGDRYRRRARCSSSPRSRRASASSSVFQRTPPWLGPTPDYHAAVAPGLQWLYAHVPSYSEWNRFLIFWKMGDGVLEGVRVDPDWEPKDHAVGLVQRLPAHAAHGIPRHAVRRPARSRSRRSCRPIRPARSGCCATTACGPGAQARQRAAGHRLDPRDHADRDRHRRRRSSTTSTSSSTARDSRRRSSSRR